MAKEGSLHVNFIDIIGLALVFLGAIIIRISSTLILQLIGAVLVTVGTVLLSGRAGK